jgi:hypothetical protein
MRTEKVAHLPGICLGAEDRENAIEQIASFPLPPNLRL